LFVADSEGSSIRSVPLDGTGEVSTIIGTSQLPKNRLFTFGDVDGPAESARLQHPLGVAYRDGKIFVADTYNNKVRSVDAKSGEVTTLIGDGKPGSSDSPPQLDEPSGLSLFNDQLYIADTNNHLIRVYDLNTSKLTTLKIEGLTPPKPKTRPEDLKIAEGAPRKKLAVQMIDATTSMIDFEVQFELPEGWKLNTLADFPITLIQSGEAKLNRKMSVKVKENKLAFQTELSALEKQTVQLAIGYYYCQADDSGLCLADTIVLEAPIERKSDSANTTIKLEYAIEP
jgi:WD40 repeat protein